jgi:hypothetical protein
VNLIAGLALLAVPAFLVPGLLGVRGGLARGVSGLVTAAAVIGLGTELLSLVDAWRSGWMLLFLLVATAGSVAAWSLGGRAAVEITVPGAARIKRAARANPLAATAVGIALLALAVQAILAVAGAPTTPTR